MIHLPSTPRTFMELIGLSVRHHFALLRKIILLIVFLVIVKDLYIYVGGMPSNSYLYSFVSIVMGLLMLYILTAILYAAHCVLYNENIDWRSALSDTILRMGRVILALIIFIVVPAILFTLAEWIARVMVSNSSGSHQYVGLILVLIVGIPVMIAYLYYLFTIPLIVTENFGVWQAFKYSPILIGPQWWNIVRVFGLYACGVAVWLLVSPDTLHGHLIKTYKLSALYDFIVFGVTLPIVMNFVVLMRNDLRLRKEIRDAE